MDADERAGTVSAVNCIYMNFVIFLYVFISP